MMETTPPTNPVKKGRLIVISGPSGVGKGTLCKKLLEANSNLFLSTSATTRSIRPNEVDGVHYHFKERHEFEAMIKQDQLLEWAEYNTHYYGTPIQSVNFQLNKGQSVLLEIEVKGALQVKEKFPEAYLIFLAPPSLDELRKRIEGRESNTEDEINQRMRISEWELSQQQKFEVQLVNDNLNDCFHKLNQLILKI